MQKIIFMVIAAAFLVSGSAFASESFSAEGPAGTPTGLLLQYKTSSKVTVVTTSAAAEYAAVSSHLNGDRVFGSSSNESILFKLAAGKTPGTSYSTAPASNLAFASGTTWDQL